MFSFCSTLLNPFLTILFRCIGQLSWTSTRLLFANFQIPCCSKMFRYIADMHRFEQGMLCTWSKSVHWPSFTPKLGHWKKLTCFIQLSFGQFFLETISLVTPMIGFYPKFFCRCTSSESESSLLMVISLMVFSLKLWYKTVSLLHLIFLSFTIILRNCFFLAFGFRFFPGAFLEA